jgi:hypothetical protein
MRRDILLGVLLTISVCTLKAQRKTEPKINLSVSFANAGLEATEAIRQCHGSMFFNESGIAVPAETQRSIDRAEKGAKTNAEKEVVIVLKALFQAKLNTNMSRSMITMFGFPTYCHERMAREADAYEAIAASEEDQRRCRVALRFILHRRSYVGPPTECKSIAP